MNAYIYQADLWCEDCIEEVKKTLTPPENPDDEHTYDSDDYPKGPYPDGGGESDCVQCCAGCHCLLENDLTADGWNNLFDSMLDNFHRKREHVNRDYWHEVFDQYGSELKDMIEERLTQ